jgi:hypothetical protein
MSSFLFDFKIQAMIHDFFMILTTLLLAMMFYTNMTRTHARMEGITEADRFVRTQKHGVREV